MRRESSAKTALPVCRASAQRTGYLPFASSRVLSELPSLRNRLRLAWIYATHATESVGVSRDGCRDASSNLIAGAQQELR